MKKCRMIILLFLCLIMTSSCITTQNKHHELAKQFLELKEGNLVRDIKKELSQNEKVQDYIEEFELYVDECVPAIIEKCCVVLMNRFSEDELRELISIYESKAYIKYCGVKEALDDELLELFMHNMYNDDEVYKRLMKRIREKQTQTQGD